jgi:hypothetical protein
MPQDKKPQMVLGSSQVGDIGTQQNWHFILMWNSPFDSRLV